MAVSCNSVMNFLSVTLVLIAVSCNHLYFCETICSGRFFDDVSCSRVPLGTLKNSKIYNDDQLLIGCSVSVF